MLQGWREIQVIFGNATSSPLGDAARCGLLGCVALLQAGLALADPGYDRLIEQARGGDHQPVLEFLRQAAELSPSRRLDHLLIAGWAGLDEEVIALYQRDAPQLAERVEVHAAAARAYRNLQRWPQALAALRQALQLQPERDDLLTLEVLILADGGEPAEAVRRAEALVARAPLEAEHRLALGYALLRDGRPYASLAELDRAQALAPERRDILREYLSALQRAGLPLAAGTLADRHPGLLGAEQRRSLEADLLAERVRLAGAPTRREDERFVIADRALAHAEQLLEDWQGLEDAAQQRLRVRIDRLGALHARVRMAELVDEYRRLQAEQVELPAYAQRWVASALLYLRQPQEAARLYRQILGDASAADPERYGDHQALYYALLESGALDEAGAIAQRLAEQQPRRLRQKGVPDGVLNEAWLSAQALRAAAHLNMDDTPAAEQAFAELSDSVPNNTWLRSSLAGIYQARGWPRRAERELKIAESTAPRSLDVQVGQGMNAQALQEWRQLELLADEVIGRYPENLAAQRLERQRRLHSRAELRVSGYRGHTSSSQVNGSGDLGIDTLLYSPPIDHDWRLFAGYGFGRSDFAEGSGHHRWQRAGLERRVRDHSLEAEVSNHDYGHGQRLGLRLSGAHDLDDHWRYGWSLERLSADTPLRALNDDIDGDGLSAYLRWRANERREWRAALGMLRLSDGNERYSLYLNGRERLYSAPRLSLDLGMELSRSHNSNGLERGASQPADACSNSRDDYGCYFNPRDDLSLMASLSANHVLYRHYATQWSQQLQLGLGDYRQASYGHGVMALASYGQRLRLDERFDSGFALSLLSRPYDGDHEDGYRLVFDLNYRF